MLKCDIIPLNNDVDDDMELGDDKKERKTGAIRPKVSLIDNLYE